MRYYFLALLVWLIKILLWISIIGIAIERYLSDNNCWFEKPFEEAEHVYLRSL